MNGQPAKFGPEPAKKMYTAVSVRVSLEPKYETYYAKLSVGRPPNWNTDQRSKDLFCLSQWLMDELMILKCPDEDRRDVQDFFNRKSRAEEDLFELAAKAVNSFLNGTIERYRRFKRQ